MSLRPQDPIPDWITHLVILGSGYTVALTGPKEEVLFSVYRWGNAFNSQKGGTAERMATLMTRRYGQALTDVGHKLSADGVTQYKTYSRIMSSRKPSYIQPTGEVFPELLNPADEKRWRKAAEKSPNKADLDDLLALTCLLPIDLNRHDDEPSPKPASAVSTGLKDSKTESPPLMPPQITLSSPLVELNNVVVSYGSKTVLGQGVQPGFSTPGLNLTIREGSRIALLGPNGSGKTTLLSLLTSDHPQSYSLPIKYFDRHRLPLPGQPGLSLWEIQSRIGHSSPEIHVFFPRGLTIRRALESAWADTFSAKPKLTDKGNKLVNAFLGWWQPELDPSYRPPPPTEPSASPIDDWMSTCYPPLTHSTKIANELGWASSPAITFGTLTFQSQRLLLLLRAIIKNPDIVILDEAFSGFSPAVREKAMSFLTAGEGRMLLQRQPIEVSSLVSNEGESVEEKSSLEIEKNSRCDIDMICRKMSIKVDDLLAEQEVTSPDARARVDHLRSMSLTQLNAMVVDENDLSGYTFTGLNTRQALVVVSHVREEIPDVVNEYVRLPGEEEVIEQGRSVEMGTCENGSIRTVEGWSRIWALRS
jgi:ABC-type molybdenum transport system ATPase subunit/photorepair protein PhrA